MSVCSARPASRAQPAQRLRTGSRYCCVVAATVLALGGVWRSTSKHGAGPTAFFKSKESGSGVDVVAAVQEAMPGAMPSSDVFAKVQKALRTYDVKANNVIFGTSASPDELSNSKGQLSAIMSDHFGNVFPMGGLAGVPFAGKTGFGAFSSHVPDTGHVVVMFGPHIGFSPSAEAGTYLRTGQSTVSAACGALTAAYDQIGGEDVIDDPLDMQQAWLRHKMAPYYEQASSSSCPMVDWVMSAYKVIETEMMAIVNTDYGDGNLVLLGGVSVNLPSSSPGYFLPLHFSVRAAGADPIDLLSELQ